MHVGEKPYVVTATGHAELAAKPLTIPAMTGMLDQLLPPDSRQVLDELGAVEYQLPPQPQSPPDMHYSVVAARGGDDIWIEVRRRQAEPEPEPVPETEPVSAAPAAIAVAADPETYTLETSGPVVVDEPAPTGVVEVEPDPARYTAEPESESELVSEPEPARGRTSETETVALPAPAAFQPESVTAVELDPVMGSAPEAIAFVESQVSRVEEPRDEERYALGFEESAAASTEDADVLILDEPAPLAEEPIVPVEEHVAAQPPPKSTVADEPVAEPSLAEAPLAEVQVAEVQVAEVQVAEVQVADVAVAEAPAARVEQVARIAPEPVAQAAEAAREEEPGQDERRAEEPEDEAEPEPAIPHHLAPVVPMAARVAARHEVTLPSSSLHPRGEGLPHLLQVAAAQGASVLYVAVQAKPSLRVDGEIRVLDHEAPLSEALLESGLKAILPSGAAVAVGEVQTCDVAGVGRVQCLSFRDHRGLGAMFKMLPARAISSEQMGLGAPIQSLCTETEGLVLVSGARGAGKSTLVAALVDQVNRTRCDHVITVEQQIQYVHENRHSFVSQREAHEDESFAEAVRSALREGPDVLVVDHVASPAAALAALHAAASGHLVIASITAPTTTAAMSRFMELFGEERADARCTLSEHLRGVITQSLLRKTGGGLAAAREVLVNVPSVAALIADGHFEQLGSVLNGGRRVGMVPLNDALLALVQSGALDVREAYRKSPDQQELVSQLNRAGLDTTFAERLA
jgi:twitching motility protein PilT